MLPGAVYPTETLGSESITVGEQGTADKLRKRLGVDVEQGGCSLSDNRNHTSHESRSGWMEGHRSALTGA